MRLEVLHVTECPDVPPMLAQLVEATDSSVDSGRSALTLRWPRWE